MPEMEWDGNGEKSALSREHSAVSLPRGARTNSETHLEYVGSIDSSRARQRQREIRIEIGDAPATPRSFGSMAVGLPDRHRSERSKASLLDQLIERAQRDRCCGVSGRPKVQKSICGSAIVESA